ncbi:MAG: hypothetical protein DRP87_05530 [Spirochaetes bacterium]|nr:MAG: hypothetical protein DRP87_05530 [Spirochaetota bacterium]
MSSYFLMDTHALVFWQNKEEMDDSVIEFLDDQAAGGNVFVSPISFWELSLLVKKGRIALDNISRWKEDILNFSGVLILNPDIDDMIASVHLPDHHKDPFDRLLVVQAIRHGAFLVSRDESLRKYPVKLYWG